MTRRRPKVRSIPRQTGFCRSVPIAVAACGSSATVRAAPPRHHRPRLHSGAIRHETRHADCRPKPREQNRTHRINLPAWGQSFARPALQNGPQTEKISPKTLKLRQRSVNQPYRATSPPARDNQPGNSPAQQIATIPIAAATPNSPPPNPRAFVQSGFNEVRPSPSRKTELRTSQKPLDSRGLGIVV